MPPAEATLDISEARKKFNTLDRDLQDDCVIYVTRHNKKAFAVVNVEYLTTVMETLEVLADPEALQLLQDSIADIRAGRVFDQDEVERELL